MDYTLNQLFEFSRDKGVIVTPNQRISATLHRLYNEKQLAHQVTTWETPTILPFQTWLTNLFNLINLNAHSPYLLLNTEQEHFLWVGVVDQLKNNLLQLNQTADMLKKAWGLLKEWELSLDDECFDHTEDTLFFKQCAEKLLAMCSANHFITQAEILPFVIDIVHRGEIALPKSIIFLGFTELSPAMYRLVQALRGRGCHIDIANCQSETCNSSFSIKTENADHEIETLARWAHHLYKTDPKGRIACVVPDLEANREDILHTFDTIFADEYHVKVEHDARPYNISAGKRLASVPIVKIALEICGLNHGTIKYERFNQLLFTPFLGKAESEKKSRHLLDNRLREQNVCQFNLKVPGFSERLVKRYTPHLYRLLHETTLYFAQFEEAKSYEAWAQIFIDGLNISGWPGERSLNSEEYQALEAFLEVLNRFKTLDSIATPTTYWYALQALNKLAASTVFHVKTTDARIHILGLLEAVGLPFDYVWVTGLDDTAWPPSPKPNPFLPRQLQRQLNMPHATAQRELQFCRAMLTQFQNNTKVSYFSYAEKNDQIVLSPSPLIKDFKVKDIFSELPPYESKIDSLYALKEIEAETDDVGLALQPDEHVKGGINTLKQQALCPFKAYAEWRLHARPLEVASSGLRAKERGIIIHKALELFWNDIKDHETLINLDDETLHSQLQKSINATFKALAFTEALPSQYKRLEKKRLERVLSDWLEVESTRQPFKVHQSEVALNLDCLPFNLSVRVDRIDEIAEQTYLIIDYKTGKSNDIHQWFSERPEEPQLLLYLLNDPARIGGISFAQIAPGEHMFKGISEYDIAITGVKDISKVKHAENRKWHEQVNQWQTHIMKLGHDFSLGYAIVDPKNGAETCTWCQLKPLCRISDHDATGGSHD